MSAISLYQAFIPTSSHNVGVIVDPGAEIIQEVVGLVDVSFCFFFDFIPFFPRGYVLCCSYSLVSSAI
jgi:hypothetical protein